MYNANRPEVHDVLRRWREIADAYDPPRVLIGETFVLELDDARAVLRRTATSCNLAFNFLFMHAAVRRRRRCAAIVEATEDALPPAAWPVWTGVATTTSTGSRRAGAAATRRRRAVRAGDAAHACAARRSSTTATRSACPTPRSPATGVLDPVG